MIIMILLIIHMSNNDTNTNTNHNAAAEGEEGREGGRGLRRPLAGQKAGTPAPLRRKKKRKASRRM